MANQRLFALVGAQPDPTLLGRRFSALYRTMVKEPARPIRVVQALKAGKVYSGEVRLTLHAREELVVKATVSPLHDKHGTVIGALAVIQDATEETRAARVRLTTKRALLHLTDVGIFIVNAENHVIFSNRLPEQAVGVDWATAMARYGPDELLTRVKELLDTSHETIDDTVMLSEPERVIRLTMRRVRSDEHHLMGTVVFASDITAEAMLRRQLRQAEQLGIIGELATNTAHELRNPLTALRATAQLGTMLSDPKKKDEAFRRIMQEIDRLDGLIDELFSLAQPGESTPVPTQMSALVDDVIALVHGQLIVQNITLSKMIGDDLTPIPLHRKLFRRALLNVVLNALQAMPEGGQLTIEGTSNPRRGVLRLSITDTGPGMSEKVRQRLFLPFFSTRGSAAGLGMAVAHQIIVQFHHGRIDCESKPGEGTAVYIELPYRPMSFLEAAASLEIEPGSLHKGP